MCRKELSMREIRERVELIFGDEVIVESRDKGTQILNVLTKYGKHRTRIHYLFYGKKPGITTAVDKNQYFRNMYNDKFPDNQYDLSEIDYKDNKTKIKIICPKHGSFETTPHDLLNHNAGCPICASNKKHLNVAKGKIFKNIESYSNEKAHLYLLFCENESESFFKLGYTTRDIKERFNSKCDMPYNYNILIDYETDRLTAAVFEYLYLNVVYEQEITYKPNLKFGGDRECIIDNKLGEILIQKLFDLLEYEPSISPDELIDAINFNNVMVNVMLMAEELL